MSLFPACRCCGGELQEGTEAAEVQSFCADCNSKFVLYRALAAGDLIVYESLREKHPRACKFLMGIDDHLHRGVLKVAKFLNPAWIKHCHPDVALGHSKKAF